MRMTARQVVATILGIAVVCVLSLALWRIDMFGMRSATPFATVATAFDPPPGLGGLGWTRAGRFVERGEVHTIGGPEHCGWQSATLLFIGWPPPRVSAFASEARLYIRDPHGAVSAEYRDRLQTHATLPPDARATGYRYGVIEIYLSPSDQDDAIYLVAPAGAERWPRSDPMTACA